MIRVLFFARLREQLDCATLELDWPEQNATVADLRECLCGRGEHWRAALQADNIICAVNQRQACPGDTLAAGDEVAFYPPVTGG